MQLIIVIYISLILLPICAGVLKLNKKTYNALYVVTLFIIVAIPFFIKTLPDGLLMRIGIDNSKKTDTIWFALVLSVLSVYCKYMINLHKEYREIKNDLEEQIGKLNKHPVLNSKNDINDVIAYTFNLSRSRDLVLDFFKDSLCEIKVKGVARIEAEFSEYTILLGKLMDNATSVIGTFTKTPDLIRKKYEKNDESTKKYLATLSKNKAKIKRICVLEKDEIDKVSQEEKNAKKGKKLSDINWFIEHVPAEKTKWAETGVFRHDLGACGFTIENFVPSSRKRMVDFAIFDDILLRWGAPDKAECGTIVMLVGEEAISLRKAMEKYIDNDVYGFMTFNDLAKHY